MSLQIFPMMHPKKYHRSSYVQPHRENTKKLVDYGAGREGTATKQLRTASPTAWRRFQSTELQTTFPTPTLQMLWEKNETLSWFLQYVTITTIPVQSSHCVCGRITQAVSAPAGLRQGQGDPSGHQERMKTESQPPSQNCSHSESGSPGSAPSIFVLPGFWQLCEEARGLSCTASDINKALMTGNDPWYTMGAWPTLPVAHWLRDIHGVVLQECFTLLIIVRSSYKGWCINKDTYENVDSEEMESGHSW